MIMGDEIWTYIYGAALSVGGWFVKELYGEVKSTKKDLGDLKTHVAENYVPNHQFVSLARDIKDEVRYIREDLRLIINSKEDKH